MFKENHWDGQNHSLIAAQKDFKKAMDNKVNEIVESLPEMLRPIIMKAAEDLEANLPDELKGEDPITHDELDRDAIYMRLLFACSNKLGHGASWLK